ncbi:hypothetical protein Tco_1273215 [Tanacetum coccineum]
MTNLIITTTSNSQMHNDIMAVGSRERPPMLAIGRYAQWQSRFMRYVDAKSNKKELKKCIIDGPYVMTRVLVLAKLATETDPPVPEHIVLETYENTLPKNRAYIDAEAEAIHMILSGIRDAIFSTVNACITAKEMWTTIERLQLGESLNKQDVKTNLFWKFGKFTSRDGESIESYYSRFYKMMNEMVQGFENKAKNDDFRMSFDDVFTFIEIQTRSRVQDWLRLGFAICSTTTSDATWPTPVAANDCTRLQRLQVMSMINEVELQALADLKSIMYGLRSERFGIEFCVELKYFEDCCFKNSMDPCGPPPAGPIPQDPAPDLRTIEELCQPTINGQGRPIAPVNIQATNFGLKNHMIQQVQQSCQYHGLPGDDTKKHLQP